MRINPSANTARGHARELPEPSTWTDRTARSVFDALQSQPCLVDMYLVEGSPRPVAHAEMSAYGSRPHVIAYRMWDMPGEFENAEDYLSRHIKKARQLLGGVPYIDGVALI